MNGVLKILRHDGIRQRIIVRCIDCKGRQNNKPQDPYQGKYVHINGRLIKIPPPPTTCCMSGCANCVYIAYAEEINQIFRDGGQLAKEIILDSVEDPNMKTFLSMELRNAENNWRK